MVNDYPQMMSETSMRRESLDERVKASLCTDFERISISNNSIGNASAVS
jgi:hypothetical protein